MEDAHKAFCPNCGRVVPCYCMVGPTSEHFTEDDCSVCLSKKETKVYPSVLNRAGWDGFL